MNLGFFFNFLFVNKFSWKFYYEFGTFAKFGTYIYLAIKQVDETFDDEESEAAAFDKTFVIVDAGKRLEDLV